MIKVLHVYKTALPVTFGGVESFIDSLCRGNKSEVINQVFCLNKKPCNSKIMFNGYIVHQAKQDFYFASTGFSVSAFRVFQKIVDDFDIIHYHFPNPFADILHFLCKLDKPFIVTYHSDIVNHKALYYLYRPFMISFLNKAKHVVCTSSNYMKSSPIINRLTTNKSIIPLGIDKMFAKDLSNNRKSYWQSRFKKPFFLFIGVIRYYKGLEFAIDAFNQTDALFVIAGEGPRKRELENLVMKKSINNIIFLGEIQEEDKKCLLDLCYAFIFPSHLRSEAFGISLLEASIFEKAMITCDISTGTSYVNKHNETGLVVKPASSSELKKAILYFLSNPEIVKTFGLNARKRVITNFCDELISQKYLDLYKRIVT